MKLTKSYIKKLILETLNELNTGASIPPGSPADKASQALLKSQYSISDKEAEEVNALRQKLSAVQKAGNLSDDDIVTVLQNQGIDGKSEAIKKVAQSNYSKEQKTKNPSSPDAKFANILSKLSGQI